MSQPTEKNSLRGVVRAHGEQVFLVLLLAGATLGLLAPLMWDSLSWRLRHDTPFLLYMGYIIERFGMIPYRDFFDVNMLGSYLSYQMIGRFFGFSDAGIHRGDLALLLFLMGVTVAILWRLGRLAAWAGAVLFALIYLREGSAMTLQRDYIGVIPAAVGVAIAVGLPRVPVAWRALLAGIAFGCAAAIKPHAVIGLLPVLLYLTEEQLEGAATWRTRGVAFFWNGVQAALGGLLPVLAYVGYLVYHGALDDFLSSALQYVPLYAELTKTHALLTPEARRVYVVEEFLLFGKRLPLLAIGLVGIGAGFARFRADATRRRVVSLVSLLAIAYMFYPAVTGQYWGYHYMPMTYFLCLGAAMVFVPGDAGTRWQQRWLPRVLVLLMLGNLLYLSQGFSPLFAQSNRATPKGGRVEAIATYLKENLRPGDTVQPLDWVSGGMLQAMLYADARPATEFLTYFDFFHHVDLPYIQQLRERFVRRLDETRPRFIIKWIPTADWIKPGPRTAKDFPAAEAYIKVNYVERMKGKGYIIYERKDTSNAGTAE